MTGTGTRWPPLLAGAGRPVNAGGTGRSPFPPYTHASYCAWWGWRGWGLRNTLNLEGCREVGGSEVPLGITLSPARTQLQPIQHEALSLGTGLGLGVSLLGGVPQLQGSSGGDGGGGGGGGSMAMTMTVSVQGLALEGNKEGIEVGREARRKWGRQACSHLCAQ